MKAVYLTAHHQFERRDVALRAHGPGEALGRVAACGFCGHDKILADYAAEDWQPFGHEFAGVVEKVGHGVKNVRVGDRVVIETSTFDPLSPEAQNGHPDLDTDGPSYMNMAHTAMGFSERTIVPAILCYPFDGISDEEACFAEPMGVAADLVLTADIKLGNDVAVMGCGAIGLMAMQMAKASGARHVYAIEHAHNKRKIELARAYGADEVLLSDEIDLTKYPFPRGGVDRVLVTTPPKTIDLATRICAVGGIVAFLGISYGPAATVSFDSNIVHLNKLQIRGSNAIPALYFPHCFDLMHAGMVDVKQLISHRFTLDNAPEGILSFLHDHDTAVKAVMVSE